MQGLRLVDHNQAAEEIARRVQISRVWVALEYQYASDLALSPFISWSVTDPRPRSL